MSRRKGPSAGELFVLLAAALALGWVLKQLFNLLRWLLRLTVQLWCASKPERDKIWAVAADEVDRLMGRLMDYRLVDLSLCFFGGVLLILVLVDSSWVIKTLDNFGDTNVPFVGWAVLGFAGGAAMSAISRLLEIDWLRIRLPVALVPDIDHLREGEIEAHRSLRVRQVIGVIGITVLAALFGVGYWQNSQFPYGASSDVKAQAIAAAAKSANMAVLNDALAYAAVRIEVNPKVALRSLVVLINASKTSKDAAVLKIAADANRYLEKYRLDTDWAENFLICIDGRYPSLCNHSKLTASESARVAEAERVENLKTCIDGRYPSLCNHLKLTASESIRVAEAERAENLKICNDGRYPALCNHSLLKE
jgi:hypothetical protein